MSNELIGKRISFYQLFSINNFYIEIPTIQRDYAQGRSSKIEVREQFLNALMDYLEENIPNRDLDFVYGSTEDKDGIKKFIPLDGQQRLTTLFLLHWYLANLAGKESYENFQATISTNNKSKFNYLTRPSSTEFTDALVNNGINLNELLNKNDNNTLSQTLKDKGWYFLSWNYDPTVQSMLTMLDAIHNKFNTKAYYYNRLIDTENPIITFLFLDLKEFKLTEDLYIKMNSRGKPLTAFENFKAKLEQHIADLFGNVDKPFIIASTNTPSTYKEYFSFQIDTTWANLFWNYRTLVGKPFTYDEELMNFIRVIIANQFAIENAEKLEAYKELIEEETATAEITENISFYKFQSLGSLSKNCIEYLINSFDVLVYGNEKIKNYFDTNFYCNENELFETALKYSITKPQRALFHSYIKYLITHKTNKNNFHQWMRVMHNLIENSRIEVAEQLISATKSIEKLLIFSDDILEYLVSLKCDIEHFSTWQVFEEIIKAHLILKSDTWRNLIEQTEKDIFHKGQISYLLEFSGITEYFNSNKNVNWTEKEDEKFLNKFNDYALKSKSLFAIFDTPENKDYLIERALLTKGNYLIDFKYNRYNFCSSTKAPNYQRDFSWKRLLRLDKDEDWMSRRKIVQKLLDDIRIVGNDIKLELLGICNDVVDDWRDYFIQTPGLLSYCRQGFIYFIEKESYNYIELYYAHQQNHYHIEMFAYNFYLNFLEGKETLFTPFKSVNWCAVKNENDPSFVSIDGFIYQRKEYTIEIFKVKEKFLIEFKKAKGNKSKDEYNVEIITTLESNKFKWDEEEGCFFKHSSTENSTNNLLITLCKELQTITI